MSDLTESKVTVMLYDGALLRHGTTPLGTVVAILNPAVLPPMSAEAAAKVGHTPQ